MGKRRSVRIIFRRSINFIFINHYYGRHKLPLIKELRAEQKKLRTEVEKLKNEIRDEKPQLEELKNMRRNIEMFLGRDDCQRHERNYKRTGELE